MHSQCLELYSTVKPRKEANDMILADFKSSFRYFDFQKQVQHQRTSRGNLGRMLTVVTLDFAL